ncbi:hypothetical protein FKM82_014975 [Ascaphus truei]
MLSCSPPPTPGLEQICLILSRVAPDRLAFLRHRLEHQRPGTDSHKLLRALILLALNRRPEALQSLSSLPHCQLAQHITQAVIEGKAQQVRGVLVLPPTQDPEILQITKQIYSLLTQEDLCQGRVVTNTSGNNPWVDMEGCLHSDDTPHTLCSGPFGNWIPRRSSEIPINRVGNTPLSVTPLQISQSPTLAFNTHHGNASKRGLMDTQTPNVNRTFPPQRTTGSSLPPEVPRPATLQPFCSNPCVQPPLGHVPVMCTDHTVTSQKVFIDPEREKLSKKDPSVTGESSSNRIPEHGSMPREAEVITPDPLPPTDAASDLLLKYDTSSAALSHVDSHSAPPSDPVPPTFTHPIHSSPIQNPSYVNYTHPSSCSHLYVPPPLVPATPTSVHSSASSCPQFFSFVVFHVREDLAVACKVRDVLQELGAGEGVTFGEEFERPGVSPLVCMQDAVESCAYVILLLTMRFETKWAEFQSNTVLMNSIDDHNKCGSVLPYLPKSDRLRKLPLTLRTLIALDEMSPVFHRTVRNTFKLEVIHSQKERWRKEQEMKAMTRSVEDLSDEMNRNLQIQNLYKQLYDQLSSTNLPPLPSYPGIPLAPPGHYLFPCLPPGLDPRVFRGPYPPPEASAENPLCSATGQTPIIQINHARCVQIGDNNTMRVQQGVSGGGEEGEGGWPQNTSRNRQK